MNDCFFYEKGTGVAHMQAFKVISIINLRPWIELDSTYIKALSEI